MQLSTILRSPISNTTKLEKYLKAEAATAWFNEHGTWNWKAYMQSSLQRLITSQCFPPPTAEKRLIEHDFDMQERKNIYSLPFLVTKEVRLSVFQYKTVHSIMYTNKILHKMKKKDNPYCPFCTGVERTITHLFFHAQLLYLSGQSSRAGTIRCAKISLFLQKKRNHLRCANWLAVLFNPESFDLNWKILALH